MASSHEPKRTVDFQISGVYPSNMTRVEMLAKAMRGVVVEDEGYRGVIHIPETNEYVRYHSTHGVHSVLRNARTWRATRLILAAEEVRPFLEEQGVLPKISLERKDPFLSIKEVLQAEIAARFQTGGGVLKLPSGTYVRFSQIAGLDVVDFIVSKWRVVAHLADRNDVLRALLEDPTRIAAMVAKKERVA